MTWTLLLSSDSRICFILPGASWRNPESRHLCEAPGPAQGIESHLCTCPSAQSNKLKP